MMDRKIKVKTIHGLMDFNANKISEAIDRAIVGLDSNKYSRIELESKFNLIIKDNISTSEIQENLINEALKLANEQNPKWLNVAGRLFYNHYAKKVQKSRKIKYGDFYEYLTEQVVEGNIDYSIFGEYTNSEIQEIGSFLNIDYDQDYDYAGYKMLVNRYLLKNELIQEMYLTISMFLMQHEKLNRLEKIKDTYTLLATKKLSLATPILLNLRKPTRGKQNNLGSCYVLTIDDNINSIFDNVKKVAKISKEGGGIGICFSKIRANGSTINGHENASNGVVPFIKIFNDTAVAINQGGQRAGAVTVALDLWHLDIFDFLEMQTESGDFRKKAFDVFPQVVVPDIFMESVVKGDDFDWYLFDPYEVKQKTGKDITELYGKEFEDLYACLIENAKKGGIKNYKVVNGKNLVKTIMKTQIETGLPYVFFKDTANKMNPNKHRGIIPCANLCTESFSIIKAEKYIHSCNLLSINLANIENGELPNVVKNAVFILNKTLDTGGAPVSEAQSHNKEFRVIGIGAMGLSDYLAKRKLDLFSGKQEISKVFETIFYYGVLQSVEMAKERGAYPAFENSEWEKGLTLFKDTIENKSLIIAKEQWESLDEKIKEHGIYNSQIFAIAPNTSTSIIQCCTASILPPFEIFFVDSNGKLNAPIAPPYIEDFQEYYNTQKEVLPEDIIRLVSEVIQPWIDTGVSMELMYDLNSANSLSVKKSWDIAWKQGCKTIYYTRTWSRVEKRECSVCAN